ncbi:MAG: 2-phosphosulfolactate phosphatase, partial [Trueperaceae bacterium]
IKPSARAVVTSENAPKALAQVMDAETLLLGSLYNAEAVAKVALERTKGEIFIVCSGFIGQEDLDDTLTAGVLAAGLKTLQGNVELEGASRFAIALMKAFADPLEALWRSSTGQYLQSLNMVEDLAIASYLSQTDAVPILQSNEGSEQGNVFTFVKAEGGQQKVEGEKAVSSQSSAFS